MLVFDVSNRKSFRHVSYWLSNISKHASENVQVQLIGNKVDLRPESKKDPNAASKINKFMHKRRSSASKSLESAEGEVEKDPFVQTYEGNAVASK
jgi:GTPase SAR1 family protein